MDRRLSPITQKWMGIVANIVQFVCIVGIVLPTGYWLCSAIWSLYNYRRASDSIELNAPWNRGLWLSNQPTTKLAFPRYSMARGALEFMRPGSSKESIERFLGPVDKDYLPDMRTFSNDIREEPSLKSFRSHASAVKADLYFLGTIPDDIGEEWDEYLVLLFDQKQQLLDGYVSSD